MGISTSPLAADTASAARNSDPCSATAESEPLTAAELKYAAANTSGGISNIA